MTGHSMAGRGWPATPLDWWCLTAWCYSASCQHQLREWMLGWLLRKNLTEPASVIMLLMLVWTCNDHQHWETCNKQFELVVTDAFTRHKHEARADSRTSFTVTVPQARTQFLLVQTDKKHTFTHIDNTHKHTLCTGGTSQATNYT